MHQINEAFHECGFGYLLDAIAAAPPAPGHPELSVADGAASPPEAVVVADTMAFPSTIVALFSETLVFLDCSFDILFFACRCLLSLVNAR